MSIIEKSEDVRCLKLVKLDNMKYNFESIIERDTDFAIIDAFSRNKKVRQLFFDLIGRKDGEIKEVYHSLVQQEEGYGVGESDIVFVLEDQDGLFGIMIEDKINANAQPNQRERYDVRAKELEKRGLFAKHYVFLCAPQSYLDSMMASKYELKVSYESIVALLDDGLDKAVLLKGTEGGTTTIKSVPVTNFWNNLYRYVHDNYPDLRISGKPGDRPANSLWPEFKTAINGCTIIMKSNRGIVDLEFSGMGKRLYELELKLLEVGVTQKPVQTKKSASLRYEFDEQDILSFNEDFYLQIDTINKWLNKVADFDILAKQLYDTGLKNLD